MPLQDGAQRALLQNNRRASTHWLFQSTSPPVHEEEEEQEGTHAYKQKARARRTRVFSFKVDAQREQLQNKCTIGATSARDASVA
mmetsp:Transcript_15456/g.33321  ORF Transcript_15456/g.33321 Transcript_15456/m.33321 type:complete len:85 (+) Transcript_15456:1346-1600(+)